MQQTTPTTSNFVNDHIVFCHVGPEKSVPLPDAKLTTTEEIEERIQSIFRQIEKLDDAPISSRVVHISTSKRRHEKYSNLVARKEALLSRLWAIKRGKEKDDADMGAAPANAVELDGKSATVEFVSPPEFDAACQAAQQTATTTDTAPAPPPRPVVHLEIENCQSIPAIICGMAWGDVVRLTMPGTTFECVIDSTSQKNEASWLKLRAEKEKAMTKQCKASTKTEKALAKAKKDWRKPGTPAKVAPVAAVPAPATPSPALPTPAQAPPALEEIADHSPQAAPHRGELIPPPTPEPSAYRLCPKCEADQSLLTGRTIVSAPGPFCDSEPCDLCSHVIGANHDRGESIPSAGETVCTPAKSIADIRKDATLDKSTNYSGLPHLPRREFVPWAIANGYRYEAVQVADNAAKKKDESIIAYARGRYLLVPGDRSRGSNENLPAVKDAYAAIDRIEAGHYKTEYRLITPDECFYTATKTEFELYAELAPAKNSPADGTNEAPDTVGETVCTWCHKPECGDVLLLVSAQIKSAKCELLTHDEYAILADNGFDPLDADRFIPLVMWQRATPEVEPGLGNYIATGPSTPLLATIDDDEYITITESTADEIKAMPADEFQRIYETFEDGNHHSENVILMAKRYGTPADIEQAERIFADHIRIGYMPAELDAERYLLDCKLRGVAADPNQSPEFDRGIEIPPEPVGGSKYINHGKLHAGLWLSCLSPEQKANTCGYWYTITTENGQSHHAHRTRESLVAWLDMLGLSIPAGEEIPATPGTPKSFQLCGSYREDMIWGEDTERRFFSMPGREFYRMSNGRYTTAKLTIDDDGIITEHYLNPNCRRDEHDWLMVNHLIDKGEYFIATTPAPEPDRCPETKTASPLILDSGPETITAPTMTTAKAQQQAVEIIAKIDHAHQAAATSTLSFPVAKESLITSQGGNRTVKNYLTVRGANLLPEEPSSESSNDHELMPATIDDCVGESSNGQAKVDCRRGTGNDPFPRPHETDRGDQIPPEAVGDNGYLANEPNCAKSEPNAEPKPRPTMAIVADLKDNGQDHEWYPTTPEIIAMVKSSMGSRHENASILDCGAGDGRTLAALTKGTKYAIEKSSILANEMSPEIFVVGCEFWENSLIDKKVDFVFSNPPYSEYKEWAVKIINEANAKEVFLVLPERWKEQHAILDAIKDRQASHHVIGSADFLEADRKARAKVDVISINLKRIGHSWGNDQAPDVDPFTLWVEKEFPTSHRSQEKPETEEDTFTRRVNELVPGRGLVAALVEMYHAEMVTLQANFRAISQLDRSIFAELKVDFRSMSEFLRGRIAGLKSKYWRELFNHLDPITSRLTKASRASLLDTLTANVSVDFTESNIYAVTGWAIKNANGYFDSQLVDAFTGLVNKANLINYKSNQKTWGGDAWRFRDQLRDGKVTHFGLDYRCVITCYNAFDTSGYRSYVFPNGLNQSIHDMLNDLVTIANNLGFGCPSWENSLQKEWAPGQTNDFWINRAKGEILMSVKAYKNGNLHIKFNQKFLRKLNVEFGRLKGWLRNHQQAADELNISEAEAKQYFKANFALECSSVLLLEAA